MAVVSTQFFALLLGMFSSLTQGKLTSYITVHDRRKYFVSEQATSPDFLECGGAYDDDVKGLAIHLKLYRDQDHSTHTVTMTESGSTGEWPQRYTYSCSDDRLANGDGAPISSGSCKFGVLRMSMEFSGRYDCEVQSAGTGHSESSSSEVLLEIYDREILVDGSQSQDPSSGRVDEGSPLSFSCDVNRQADISSFTIQWRRNGIEVHSQTPPDLATPFVYTIPKATPTDAGRYECVVFSQSHGDLVIDTLEANNPVVVNYSPRMKFFTSPSSFRETNVAGISEIHVPRGETFLLNCTIRAYPYLYNGTISLNNRTIVDNRRIENENVEMTKTIRDPSSSEDDGVYCCEASNEMGRQRQCLIVSVYTPMNISFFGVDEKEHGCLLNGTEAVLKCKAVGSPTPTVSILSPNGTVVGRSLKDHAEADYSFRTTFTKEGSFVCRVSNDIEQAITREYKFCTRKPDSAKETLLIESIAGGGGGFLVMLILICALIMYSKRRRRCDLERAPLVSPPSRPPTDEQIEIIAPIICYDWVDIFRVIEPSFEGGDSFLDSVERRERRGGEAGSVIFCLEKWIEQNPSENLLSAVCEAAEEANKRHLAEKIATRFQDSALVGRYRALTMSSDFSSSQAETATNTS